MTFIFWPTWMTVGVTVSRSIALSDRRSTGSPTHASFQLVADPLVVERGIGRLDDAVEARASRGRL